VPVLAVAVADVVVRDLDPRVARGLGDHALDQAAVLLFDVGAAGDLGLSLADADHERITDPLELGGAQDARPADSPDRPVDALAGKGRGPELRELLLEAGDLTAKLVAKRTIAGCDEEIERHFPPAASDCCLVSERFSHTP
jgi:hypothetical protein